MEYLWTPWRMEYLKGGAGESSSASQTSLPEAKAQEQAGEDETAGGEEMKSTGCIFCDRIREPQSHDRANLVLLRAAHNFIILNLYPYNSGHLMIVPYDHTADLPRLDTGTLNEILALAQKMIRVIDAEYGPQGYNLGMNLGRVAGAGVAEHLHLHLVPRWAGDSNFMPIVGNTKVMPELLETTYDRLKARLQVDK